MIALTILLALPNVPQAAVEEYTQSYEDILREAEEYRDRNHVLRISDYDTYNDNPNALTPSEMYQKAVLGDGYDPLTGNFKTLCMDGGGLIERTLLKRSGTSSMEVVETMHELKSFLKMSSSISAEGQYGAFSGKTRVDAKLARKTEFKQSTKTVVAKYDYIMGERWLAHPRPALKIRYQQMLAAGDLQTFEKECGSTYLERAYEGASMLITYTLEKKKEVHHSDSELKAAVEARYGSAVAEGNYEQQKRSDEVLSNYHLSVFCYTDGGSARVCAEQALKLDVPGAFAALADFVDTNTGWLTAIATGVTAYDNIEPKLLEENTTFVTNAEAWEKRRADLNYICDSLDYVGCDDVNRKFDIEVSKCVQKLDDCRKPHYMDGWEVSTKSYLGSVSMYKHSEYRGEKRYYQFSLDRDYTTTTLKPGILYSLSRRGFNDVLSSFCPSSSLLQNWDVVFYQNVDGSGKKHASRDLSPGWCRSYVGEEFNDRASSFRIIPRLQ